MYGALPDRRVRRSHEHGLPRASSRRLDGSRPLNIEGPARTAFKYRGLLIKCLMTLPFPPAINAAAPSSSSVACPPIMILGCPHNRVCRYPRQLLASEKQSQPHRSHCSEVGVTHSSSSRVFSRIQLVSQPSPRRSTKACSSDVPTHGSRIPSRSWPLSSGRTFRLLLLPRQSG